VAFVPSDHYYADNVAFASAVSSAFHMATGYPHSLILIGAEEDFPEIEHGWIEAGRVIVDSPTACLHRVRRFWRDLLVTWRAMESPLQWNAELLA
jgi:mannose-1-phosphate guanylyltransferase